MICAMNTWQYTKREQMNKEVKNIIDKAVEKIIENASSEAKINKLKKKHDVKIHFVPKTYRIFGGLLQIMNNQYGNFIEILMALIIENDPRYEIIKKYSGKKRNKFQLSVMNDILINTYMSDCEAGAGKADLEFRFKSLLERIVFDSDTRFNVFEHDIDLLFKDKTTNKIYYLECKYNDDHDSDKFGSINRKFIKTYAYLVRELGIRNSAELVPILFYFTNKKDKANIYLPERTNIYRGKRFFDEFLTIDYEDVYRYMAELSENSTTIESFLKLYKKVMQV